MAARTQRTQQQPQTNAVVRIDQDAAVRALNAELDKRAAVLADSAATLIDPVKFKGIVLSTFTRTPSLWDCDPISIARAVVEAAQAGLEPTGSLGGAYLVPFWNSKTNKREAQLIIGYTGLAKLARRSGEIAKIEARVVRAADEFDFEYGLEPRLVHRPALGVPEDANNPMTHAYAIAFYRSGDKQFDVMSAAEILVIKARSKSKDRHGNPTGPWVTDEAEMWKKTPLRRMSKMLPMTVEAQRLLDAEDDYEPGRPPARQIRALPPSRIASRVMGAPVAQVGAGADSGPVAAKEPTGDGDPGPDEPQAQAPAAPAGEVAVAGDGPPEAPSPVSTEPAALCGAPSPYADLGAPDAPTCIADYGHTGNHRSGDRETWAP